MRKPRLFVDAVSSKYACRDGNDSSTEESPLVISSPDMEANSVYSPTSTPPRYPWDRSLGLCQPDEPIDGHPIQDSKPPFTPDHSPRIILNGARTKDFTPRTKQRIRIEEVTNVGIELETLPNTPTPTERQPAMLSAAKYEIRESPRVAVKDEEEVRQAELTGDEVWLLPAEEEDEETIVRRSVWWRRARGLITAVGEVMGFFTAVATATFLMQVATSVEVQFRSMDSHVRGDESGDEERCREQLMAYRIYYCAGLASAVPLVLIGAFVPIALGRACTDARGLCRTLRHVVDELGMYQSIAETIHTICSGFKWLVKIILLITLALAYLESTYDASLRKRSCHSESTAQALSHYFGWGLAIRGISSCWDFFVKVGLFKVMSHFTDITDHELSEVKTDSPNGRPF